MNRRVLITMFGAALGAAPRLANARFIPPVEFDADDFAAIRFAASDNEQVIRSASVRVSTWPNEDKAEEIRLWLTEGAGSNLPDGEFYQSEPIVYANSMLLVDDTSIVGWTTTVGVAAYRTEWVLLTMRKGSVVWDLRVSGSDAKSVRNFASDLASRLTDREVTTDLFDLLPTEEEMPDSLVLDYRMSPDAATNGQGTPVPEPTPE